MKENASYTGEEIVRTKRQPGKSPKGLVNPKRILRQFSLQLRNEYVFIFLEC